MPKEDTLYFLAFNVVLSGQECKPISYTRLGLSRDDGTLWYLIRCSEDVYAVILPRDGSKGSKIASCALLEEVSNSSCRVLVPSRYINPFPLD
jgi:hypothetical protein